MPPTSPRPDLTAERARYYRAVCGLPCAPDGYGNRIILRAGEIGALTLPAALGEQVHSMLIAGATPAPAIAYDNDRWALLTRPHRFDGDADLAARLGAVNAHLAPTGAALLLPAPCDDGTGRLRWILQPRDMFRPAMDTVLTALDDVLEARAGKRNFPHHATATSICE